MSVPRLWEWLYYNNKPENLYKYNLQLISSLEYIDRISDSINFGRNRDKLTDSEILKDIEGLLENHFNIIRNTNKGDS